MGHSPNNSSRHLYIYMPQQLKEIANPVWGSFETHENFSTYMSKFNKAHPSVKEIGWLGIVLLYSPYHLHIYSGNINGSSNGSKVDLFPRSWHFRWCAILSVSTWQHLFLMTQLLLVLHIMVSKENFVCTIYAICLTDGAGPTPVAPTCQWDKGLMCPVHEIPSLVSDPVF